MQNIKSVENLDQFKQYLLAQNGKIVQTQHWTMAQICEHCAQTIREGLKQRDRYVEVDADLEQHRLDVTLPGGELTSDGVCEVLTELGFTPKRRAA